jgi:hypothetical protein
MSDEESGNHEAPGQTPEPPDIIPFDGAGAGGHPIRSSSRTVDPRLQLVVDRWEALPEEIRQAIADTVAEQA